MPENNKPKAALTFDNALKGFVRTIKANMKFAEACAMLALEHFAEHGDTVYAQRFLDAMPKNYSRRQAYFSWLTAFSPIIMVGQKLVKDTSEHASRLDLDGARAITFWNFAPEAEIKDFSAEDLDNSLVSLVKRFMNEERQRPLDDAAKARLLQLEGLVKGFTGQNLEAANEDTSAVEDAAIADHPPAQQQNAQAA